jgi:hypothetical protein
MLDVITNFENKYNDLLCPVCKEKPDTQQHVLECSALLQNTNFITNSTVLYSDLFDSNVQKFRSVTQLFENCGRRGTNY